MVIDPQEVLSILNERLGRPTPALDAILDILQKNLWPCMQAAGFPERCRPKGFQYAGEVLEDAWPRILVGGSFRTEDWGMAFADEDEISVTCAWQPAIARREFQEALDIVCVVRAVLHHPQFRGPYVDRALSPPRMYWQKLIPAGLSIVPSGFPHYSGWMANFRLTQPPGSYLWDFPEDEE